MFLQLLLAAGAQAAAPPASVATPAAQPPAASAVTASAVPVRAYLGCVQAQARLWLSDPAPASHLASVMAACEPSLPPAATAVAAAAQSNPSYPATAAAFKAKHGAELDPLAAMTRQMHEVGERLATHVLSGGGNDYQIKMALTFDADGALIPAKAGPEAPAQPTALDRGCVRREAQLRAAEPSPTTHVDAVLAACEPLAAAAANDRARVLRTDPSVVLALARYREKHGVDADLVAASARSLHEAARQGATQILNGQAGEVTVRTTLNLDPDDASRGRAPATPALAGARPAAPPSGSR